MNRRREKQLVVLVVVSDLKGAPWRAMAHGACLAPLVKWRAPWRMAVDVDDDI